MTYNPTPGETKVPSGGEMVKGSRAASTGGVGVGVKVGVGVEVGVTVGVGVRVGSSSNTAVTVLSRFMIMTAGFHAVWNQTSVFGAEVFQLLNRQPEAAWA